MGVEEALSLRCAISAPMITRGIFCDFSSTVPIAIFRWQSLISIMTSTEIATPMDNSPSPAVPCPFLPGTEDKIDFMAMLARAGLPLTVAEDAQLGDRQSFIRAGRVKISRGEAMRAAAVIEQGAAGELTGFFPREDLSQESRQHAQFRFAKLRKMFRV
jgi:hypothetical protein